MITLWGTLKVPWCISLTYVRQTKIYTLYDACSKFKIPGTPGAEMVGN